MTDKKYPSDLTDEEWEVVRVLSIIHIYNHMILLILKTEIPHPNPPPQGGVLVGYAPRTTILHQSVGRDPVPVHTPKKVNNAYPTWLCGFSLHYCALNTAVWN